MNINDFNNLSDIGKLDYVLDCLYKAHGLFKIIYESGCGFEQQVLDELEYLGDEFSRIGFMAESHDYTGVYEDLNKNLTRLSSIVEVIDEYLYKHRKIN